VQSINTLPAFLLLPQIQHTTESGWDQPRIVPFGPLQLHPAAQVLHYGTCCFEGMKAYLGPDGRGLLFRWVVSIRVKVVFVDSGQFPAECSRHACQKQHIVQGRGATE
jgi:hypothetical protein